MVVAVMTTPSDTVAEKQPPGAQPKSPWQKTPYPNLIRYVPSGTYFGRVKVDGKLIRRSLDTHVLEVAKLRLSDFVKDHRRFTTNTPAIKGEVIVELYRKEIENDHHTTERTKLYKREILIALKKAWPAFFDTDIARISQKDCREWAARYGRDYSPSRFNGALQIVRRLFALAIEEGHRNDNPALAIKRFAVKPKELNLPTQEQFHQMATHIQTSGAPHADGCVNLFRFLAFSGVRINEARHVTWADVNFETGRLQVRITKNSKARWVPFNQSLCGLLEQLRAAWPDEPPEKQIMRVFECQKSINRAAKLTGAKRITHHDLRHLFATRCIENGVDIPTVSRWLGHQDGGALCMKTYGHLRDEHSTNEAKKVLF
jgi:integrase